MDIGKLKNLTYGDVVERANKLAETFGKDDPEYAESLALALLKNLFHPDDSKLDDIVALFGSDDDISSGLFPADTATDTEIANTEEPVTVTKTTTSVGGLPADFGATSEEAAAGAVDENPDLIEELLNTPDDQVEDFLVKNGLAAPKTDKPAEEPTEKPAEPKENKPEEKKEEKPAEKPAEPKEDKPEEKKEEKPAEKPAEDKKDESDDTMKNITSALSDRF